MIHITVVCSLAPGQVDLVTLDLPEGATVDDALQACRAGDGLLARHVLSATAADVGVWGRRRPGTTRLREGDRVEIYRPLRCDPKEARRLRHRKSPPRSKARSSPQRRPAAESR